MVKLIIFNLKTVQNKQYKSSKMSLHMLFHAIYLKINLTLYCLRSSKTQIHKFILILDI